MELVEQSPNPTMGTLRSVRYKSKHRRETWETYLEAFTLRLPLRDAAHRDGCSTGRCMQEDETHIQDNYKGNYYADNNLKTRENKCIARRTRTTGIAMLQEGKTRASQEFCDSNSLPLT
jgi:hypothetical protein